LKKLHYKIAVILVLIFSSTLLLTKPLSLNSRKSLIIQFIAYNGFGNNLYVDNIMIGKRSNFDVALTAFSNIKSDTTFLPGINNLTISPSINITNIGLNSSAGFPVVLEIPEISYLSIDTVPALSSGQTYISFQDSVALPKNTKLSLIAYLVLPTDTINYNDTLKQTSIFLSGVPKKVLLEEFTSSTSPSCGSNNIFLDTFINNHINDICPLKYHVGFPPPGIDSMYLFDSTEIDARRDYYFNNTIPTVLYNGRYKVDLPYYKDSNLSLEYKNIISQGSPVSINVTTELISADTLQSTIDVNFLYPIHNRNLKLRTAIVERLVSYNHSIGSSGESQFYDVLRKMLPDESGIPLNGDAGSTQYVFKYHIDTLLNSAELYTTAFIQSDIDREILNCEKNVLANKFRKYPSPDLSNLLISKPDFDLRKFNNRFAYSPKFLDSSSHFNYENFEGPFPPRNWHLNNLDGYLTFEKFTGVNGITLGGTNSIRMPFYNYSNIGQYDTLYSASFDSVSSLDTLRFDYAYAVYLSSFQDSLIVNISVDNGSTFTNIFRKGGYQLSTASSTTLPFYPYSNTQWRVFNYGLSEVIPPENVFTNVPDKFELFQNYPNPFNPTTKIKFRLSKNVFVSLKVFDVLGREIKTLVNDKLNVGEHIAGFDASGFSSGIYFYQLSIDNVKFSVRKMVFLK